MSRKKASRVVEYYESHDLLGTEFLRRALDRNALHIESFYFPTIASDLGDRFGRSLAFRRDAAGQGALTDADGTLVWLALDTRRHYLTVRLAAPIGEAVAAAALEAEIRRRYRSEPSTLGVPAKFWYQDKFGGGTSASREIVCPAWEEIASNYTGPTRSRLAAMMNGFRPARGGKLLLWHGPPGTGKTTALSALARAWRDWCGTEFVTDPEAFFGHAGYLMEAILEDDDEPEERDKWRLLILEDTGEMLAVDAKTQQGQRLSRLLNTVDGLIGHGLRVMLLVTTNEPVGALHPAVSRPGRCAARIEFESFDLADAAEWLAANGCDGSRARPGMTLAELYAIVEGFVVEPPQRRTVGFKA